MATKSSKKSRVNSKATSADAQLVLQLYDLRREAEMRKARNWVGGEFWPSNADEIVKLSRDFTSQQNAWFRQVFGYWEMAASLVLQGALNEQLFFATCQEMWFVFCKLQPFLKEVREKLESPQMLQNLEKLATHTAPGRDRLKQMQQRLAAFAQTRQAASGR